MTGMCIPVYVYLCAWGKLSHCYMQHCHFTFVKESAILRPFATYLHEMDFVPEDILAVKKS